MRCAICALIVNLITEVVPGGGGDLSVSGNKGEKKLKHQCFALYGYPDPIHLLNEQVCVFR